MARTLVLAALAVVAGAAQGEARDRTLRESLFIGLDTSGSFYRAGHEDALSFLAWYIYGRLNGLDGRPVPGDLVVSAFGADGVDEPGFAGKTVPQIEQLLRQRFPPTETLTHVNVFLRRVARMAGERGLLLRPITVVLISDGLPDVTASTPALGAEDAYRHIDLGPLEYLARRVTVRLAYASPPVGDRWRALVPRTRVRLAAVDHEVMKGWRARLRPGAEPAAQDDLWRWIRSTVDVRVRPGA